MATYIDTPPLSAWAQVADLTLNVPNNGMPLMKRIYKIPTSICKNILNNVKRGTSIEYLEAWIRQNAGALDSGLSGASFSPTLSDSWVLDSYYLDLQAAGEYMLLRSIFTFTTLNIDSIAELSNWSETYTNSIQVTWQPYSVSPYIYCDEVDHTDLSVSPIGQAAEPSGAHAKRRHIEQAFTQNAQNSDNNTYLWSNGNSTFLLTNSEIQIMEKVAAGVNPVFHKPVIVTTNTYRTNVEHNVPSSTPDIDKIQQTVPADVPGWNGSWIFTGRAWTKTSETYYTEQHPEGVTIYTMTYTDTWEGAREPDQDFYGANAWEFHKGPDRGNN